MKFLDTELLQFSQTCKSWRKFCLQKNVFSFHEKELLLENELILTSDELDEEYNMLQTKFSEIGNVHFLETIFITFIRKKF